MKKYLGIICAILLVFSLSSCGVNKELDELEVEGRKISTNDAKDMVEDWDKYEEDLKLEDQLHEGWYSISMDIIQKNSNEDSDTQLYMSLSGKVYESFYSFETKMKLTLRLEGSYYDKEESIETKYDGTVKVIYIDGKAYYDVSLTSRTDDQYESTTNKMNALIVGDISDLGMVSVGSQSSAEGAVKMLMSYLRQLAARDEESESEDEKLDVYREDDIYYVERSTNFEATDIEKEELSQMKIEMNEEYEVKEFETYSYMRDRNKDTSTEIIQASSVKESLGTLVMKPLNHKKYVNGDLNDILGVIAGGYR